MRTPLDFLFSKWPWLPGSFASGAILLAMTGCQMPWAVNVEDLAGELRHEAAQPLALRARIEATSRLSQVEKVNLEATITSAEADLREAAALLSLGAPPVQDVEGLIGNAKSKFRSITAYLGGSQ